MTNSCLTVLILIVMSFIPVAKMTDVSTQLPDGDPIDKCPGAKYLTYPTAYSFVHLIIEEEMYYCWMAIAAIIMYAFTIIVFFKLLIDTWKIRDEQIHGDVVISIVTPVIVATCCMVGIFFPRSNPQMYTIALIFMMFAFWRCYVLFIRLYGDTQHFSDIMYRTNSGMKIASIPLCCLFFVKPIKPTMFVMNLMKGLMIQSPIIRVFLHCVVDIIRTEGLCDSTVETELLMIIDMVSTALSLYGVAVIVRSSVDIVAKYQVHNIFRVVNACQCIYEMQRTIFDLLTMNDNIFKDMYFEVTEGKTHGIEVLEARVQADFWNNVIMLFWFIPMNILLLLVLRPGACALLDLPILPISHVDTHGNFVSGAYENGSMSINGDVKPVSYRNSIVDYEASIQGGYTDMERKRTATFRAQQKLEQNPLALPNALSLPAGHH